MNTLVLGLGNVLLGDEGVGVHAVNELVARCRLPEGVEALDGGTSGLDLLDAVAGRDSLIVCDAIRADEPAGTVIRLDDENVPAFFRERLSPHQIGLAELLSSLDLIDERPAKVTLFGIVPLSMDLGAELSGEARDGMEKTIRLVAEELDCGPPRPRFETAAAGAGWRPEATEF